MSLPVRVAMKSIGIILLYSPYTSPNICLCLPDGSQGRQVEVTEILYFLLFAIKSNASSLLSAAASVVLGIL